MEAYILVKTTAGKARDVLKAIKDMDGVDSADGTYGSYDIVAMARQTIFLVW